jgi:hypothetical protein
MVRTSSTEIPLENIPRKKPVWLFSEKLPHLASSQSPELYVGSIESPSTRTVEYLAGM